jgi:hypothetical protein
VQFGEQRLHLFGGSYAEVGERLGNLGIGCRHGLRKEYNAGVRLLAALRGKPSRLKPLRGKQGVSYSFGTENLPSWDAACCAPTQQK